ATLFLDECAVAARDARVGAEREQNADRGFGVILRAMCFLELYAESGGDVAERARFFVRLDVARPHERIDPFGLAREGGNTGAVGLRAAELAHQERAVEWRVVRRRNAAAERLG